MESARRRKTPFLLVSRTLLGAQGLLWVVLAAISFFRRETAGTLVLCLMAAISAGFLVAAAVVPGHRRLRFALLLCFVIAHGVLDVAVLVMDAATAAVLAASRLDRRRAA